MDRSSLFAAVVTALAITTTGCSSGGGSPTPAPATGSSPPPPPAGSPAIQVLPATYDFGKVTSGNTPAPLEVTIKNNGSAALNVSAITFRVPADPNFMLLPSAGTRPCASVSPTVAAGDSCTVQVAFQPPASSGSFTSTLQISSNDPTSPNFGLPIAGSSEAVSALTVKINQLSTLACPDQATTAYVSVTDQGGYPVLGLQSALNAFSVAQGSGLTVLSIDSISFVGNVYQNVAIASLLDNSKSLRDQPVAFADMNAGFSSLIGNLKAGDVGEVIKFATEYEVVQPFTPDRTLLQAAIAAPFNKGDSTRLYDTAFQAVEDTAKQPTSLRRAVILATDGKEDLPASAPAVHTLQQVIDNAKNKNVPIFTVGIGGSINAADLQKLASDTGGLYYQASASQNLATIYKQLSSLLYENQYVLTFKRTATGAGSVQSPITITARSGTASPGSASRDITVCTP